jgi:hypothetical protein
MAFLDSLSEMLTNASNSPGIGGKVVRGLENAGDYARYGVSAAEKNRLMASGEIPGQPQYMVDGEVNPEAERYSSGYLATKSGHLPGILNAAGNNLAFSDAGRSPEEAMRIKMAGQRGAETAVGERRPPLKGRPFLSAIEALLKGAVPGF